MKRKFKLVSFLLALCMLFPTLNVISPVSAAAPDLLYDTDNISSEQFIAPDIVGEEEVIERGYVGRLKDAEEDLYTFVFQNSDNTNTMRVYSHPVKYVAEDGSVRDIALDIEAKSGGGFVTADHEIITTFEDKLTEGISLEYNDIEIMLVPELGLGIEPTAELSNDGKVVSYEMNDITSFVYELTYAGFKEDIVVDEYTGQTEYKFTLLTNGLTLCEEYGSYYLADAEGNAEATIGDIIVFTADERNNTMGSMTYEAVRDSQEYVLTIHLDAEYLADEDTAYPIRIDPTIEINYDNNGAGAIEDVTINSLRGSNGSSGSLYVGRRDTYGLSRVLMRFPNLSLSGISASQITAATVELRDLMCQDDEDITVECCIYNNSAPAWSESGTTSWSSVGSSYLGSLLDSHLISYGKGNAGSHRYSFNILTAAKAWANGTQSPAKGLVFKANSAFENQTGTAVKTWYKTFAAYNRSKNRPSLSINYTNIDGKEYYIAFQSDGKMLTSSSSYTLSKTTYSESNSYQKWIFTEVSSGVYIIRMKNNINKCLTAVPSSSTISISTVSSGNTNQYWKMDISPDGNGLKSKSTDTNVKDKKMYYNGGSFALSNTSYSAVGFIDVSGFIPCTSLSLSEIYINAGTSRHIYPTRYPSNANVTSGWALAYTSSSSSVFTVSDGKITAKDAGVATLTIRNKVTGASCTANVYVTRLPSPDAQNKDKWCWAACAKMVGEHNGGSGALGIGASLLTYSDGLHTYGGTKYFGKTPSLQNTSDTGQRQIVIDVHGDDKNKGGSNEAKEQALQFASKNNMSIGTLGSIFGTGLTNSDINTMRNELANGCWVIGNVFPSSGPGHSIVIQSYNSSTNVYTYWDPWTNYNGTFTSTQLENDTIRLISSPAVGRLSWIQYCR